MESIVDFTLQLPHAFLLLLHQTCTLLRHDIGHHVQFPMVENKFEDTVW